MLKHFTKLLFLSCIIVTQIHAQTAKNITLRKNIKFNNSRLANIWGYVDGTGKEYALVGVAGVDTNNVSVSDIALAIVDVTDPDNPVVKFTVTGPNSIWREVRTWGNYAYVVTEAEGGGVTIVDLSNLPNSINSKVYTDGGKISRVHALHIDQGKLYLYGGNYNNSLPQKGAIVLSLADPWNPVVLGTYSENYIHDGFASRDTIYAGHIYMGQVAVIDFTNPAAPEVVSTWTTPGMFPHNTWMSTDRKTLFTTDEVAGSVVASYDITDLSDVKELDRYQSGISTGSVAHNTHVLNNTAITGYNTDFLATAYYKDGVTIVDASRPSNLVQVGFYDTSPMSGPGYRGAWGVYPYLPSGTMLVSDIDEGLFILTPDYKRASFLEGKVTDKANGTALNNVKVELLSTGVEEMTDLGGLYEIGYADAGSYMVRLSKDGYHTRVLNVTISEGNVLNFDVEMSSLSSGIVSADVFLQASPNPFTGSLNLLYALPGSLQPDAYVAIYNVLGKEVYAHPLTESAGSFVLNPSLLTGVYYLKLHNGAFQSQEKQIIKIN